MVKHLVSISTCELKIRDHFMLFSFSQTFLFSLNELVVLKPFVEGSITDFVESLMDVWTVSQESTCSPQIIFSFRGFRQDLLKLLVCELQKETLSDDCGLLSGGTLPYLPSAPWSLAEAGVHGAALPEDWGMGFLFLLHSIC